MCSRDSFRAWLKDESRRPLVSGVVNVTPDSFSDGGRYLDSDQAVAHANALLDAGADLLDVGGESTRPGAEPVTEAVQISRVVPVIRAMASRGVAISVDTTRAAVARAALDAGATFVNDVSAGRDDPAMFELVAARQVPIVLMHMQGTPRTMQIEPTYADVVSEVESFLLDRLTAAIDAGIDRGNVLLDVGIGFGKKLEHNLSLLKHYARFAALGQPTMLGTSRKRFIGEITNKTDPNDRLFGTAASVAVGVFHGASIVRVHDVAEMVDVTRVAAAIRSAT